MRPVRLLLLLAIAPLALAQTIDTKAVDRIVQHTLDVWHIPGAAIAIVENDKLVYMNGYGVRELGKNDRVTADTLFEIASTSKAFTTTSIAMLVDEKKMKWDDPVRQYIDYFHFTDPCADSLVTPRDLVSHRSGFARHDELWDNTAFPREQIIRAVGHLKVAKPIRTAWQYNNDMFMTAGEAAGAAAGMPFDTFRRTRLFDPLGMTSTMTSSAGFLAAPNHATGHQWSSKTQTIAVQPYANIDNIGGAGDIKSNARDMAQWLRFQLADGVIDGKRLISAEALNETKTPQFVLKPEADVDFETNVRSYAMGWNVQDYRGDLLVAHAGAINGYRTQVALLPKEHAGIVVMINAGRGYAGIAIRNAIADMILGRGTRDWDAAFLAADKKGDEKALAHQKEREAKRRTDTHPSRELAAYAGTYSHPAYGPVTIGLENGALVLHWQRINAPLTHWQFDIFSAIDDVNDLDEEVTFHLGDDGNVASFTLWGEDFARLP
ncbi:MAG TPA: serine hydrolase [Thermoanaerobaculia bacterium]|jgi:CubicO group peptidase (beta-lactamase class C family)